MKTAWCPPRAQISPVLLLGALIAACAYSPRASSPGQSTVSSEKDSCLVVPAPATPRDSVLVVLEQRLVRPFPVVASVSGGTITPASDFALAQVYQQLVSVTCDGRIVSELAESWAGNAGGTEWRFVLHRDARFGSGSSVTADDVQATWSAMLRDPGAVALGDFPPLRSLTLHGEKEVSVATDESQGAAPNLFGNLSLVVRESGAGASATATATGTGPFEMVPSSLTAGGELLKPRAGYTGPTIVARAVGSADARDILDRGADLVQTRDPETLDYARRGPFTIHPLPFDRSYLLVIPGHSRNRNGATYSGADDDAAAFRAGLALTAVRGEARASAAKGWWSSHNACVAVSTSDVPAPAATAAATPPRILFEPGDPVAQSLAERIVALARSSTGGGVGDAALLASLSPVLTPSSSVQLTASAADAAALRAGSGAAYVIRLPARTTAPCLELRRLRQVAPWIAADLFFPLVDSRSFLVARAGAPAVLVDWDGLLRIQPTSRPREVPHQ